MDSPTLLDRCPFCDYRLEGLPTEHRCPECGQPFDRRWRVFGGQRYWCAMSGAERFRFIIDMIACLTVGLVIWIIPALWCHIAAVIWTGFGVVYVLQILIRRASEFIAVGPQGVTLGNRRLRVTRHFPWSYLHRVEVCKLDQLAVHAGDQEVHCSIGPKSQIRRCAEYINSYDYPCKNE